MHIIMFRHHQHLLKINVKLFVVLQMYHNGIVPHNYLQRSIHAHYLMYFTNIKVSRLQATMGKYLSLEGFRTSITTSISNVSPKNHSFIIELTHPIGWKCRIPEPSSFFISRQDNQEWEFDRQISFFQLRNEQFSFILLLVSLFLLFQLLITFKVQNGPNFFNILLIVITLVFVQEKSIMHPSIL